jgi:hypothetical protein
MAEKSEIETLRADARNTRKLAQMTNDDTARETLERIADRYDSQRTALEALKEAGIAAAATAKNELSLARVGAIQDIPDAEETETELA